MNKSNKKNKTNKRINKRNKMIRINRTNKRGGASNSPVRNPGINNVNQNNGFSATIVKNNKLNKTNKLPQTNDLCKNIYKVGKNTTKKNYVPSQLPKLTGLSQKYAVKKELVVSNEEKDEEKDEEKLKEREEQMKREIKEKAQKDVAAVKDAEEKQRLYEEAVLEAEKEYELNKRKL